ncbi:hypothetical protein D3C79_1115690 [compost metagenome]
MRGIDGQVGLDQVMQHARELTAAGAGNDSADLWIEQVRIHRVVHEVRWFDFPSGCWPASWAAFGRWWLS